MRRSRRPLVIYYYITIIIIDLYRSLFCFSFPPFNFQNFWLGSINVEFYGDNYLSADICYLLTVISRMMCRHMFYIVLL